MVSRADIKSLRAGRREALIAQGALIDAYKVTRGRRIPSGKVYARRPKHRSQEV